MLSIVDVHKRFRGHVVLAGASLLLEPGRACVVRGGNGSGKSTLCEIVCGVLDADAGAVTIGGHPSRDARARALVGYAPSAAALPEHLALHEWIDLVASLHRARALAVDAAVDAWGLSGITDTTLAALSLGQRRRLALACAELASPRLLVLDEPTVGLDEAGRSTLDDRLARHLAGGGAALIASHDLALEGARELVLERGVLRAVETAAPA